MFSVHIALYSDSFVQRMAKSGGGTKSGGREKLVFISRFKPISNKNFINKIRRSFAATRRELSK